MAEALFYHLERSRLEDALPLLLEKALARGLRCVVKCGETERMDLLDQHLWTYRDDAFLPHAQAGGDEDDKQPVLLSADHAATNGATVLFTVDGARPGPWDAFDRTCIMFDGGSEDAVRTARALWKEAKDFGVAATYWRQTREGGWAKGA